MHAKDYNIYLQSFSPTNKLGLKWLGPGIIELLSISENQFIVRINDILYTVSIKRVWPVKNGENVMLP